jgi:hypothetical protein
MPRPAAGRPGDYNRVYGADATFRFFGSTDWNTYVVRTATPGFTSGQYAARSTVNHEGRFFHFKGGLLSIGNHFNDDLGYYHRVGVRKWMLDTGIRPRVAALQRHGVREMHPHIVWGYYTNQQGRVVAKQLHTGYTFFFNNGGYTEVSVNPKYELIDTPFEIHHGSPSIPAGGYAWHEYQWKLFTDPSRVLSGGITLVGGGLWSGTQKTVAASVAVRPSAYLSVNIGVQRTDARLDLPATSFTTDLWTMRANYSFSRNMFLDSLIQYSRDQGQLNANVRFNFIHHPLSDLFIVYNEQRLTTAEALPTGRGLIVKFTQMLAF